MSSSSNPPNNEQVIWRVDVSERRGPHGDIIWSEAITCFEKFDDTKDFAIKFFWHNFDKRTTADLIQVFEKQYNRREIQELMDVPYGAPRAKELRFEMEVLLAEYRDGASTAQVTVTLMRLCLSGENQAANVLVGMAKRRKGIE